MTGGANICAGDVCTCQGARTTTPVSFLWDVCGGVGCVRVCECCGGEGRGAGQLCSSQHQTKVKKTDEIESKAGSVHFNDLRLEL